MRKKVAKKVPKLTAATLEFLEEVHKPEYLDEAQPVEDIIEAIERNEIECSELVRRAKSLREYQETLDMKVDHF